MRADINERENRNNEAKSWFFEKINTVPKPLDRLIGRRKRRQKLPVSWTREMTSPCISVLLTCQKGNTLKNFVLPTKRHIRWTGQIPWKTQITKAHPRNGQLK